jgi:SsrA-binding protein
MVPLKAYFNDRNILKLEIAIAKGKHAADKRQTIKEREWKREKSQLLKKHE